MAEKSKASNPAKDLKWLLIFLAGLFILWYFTGGPERAENQKPFLAPPVGVR